jgi:hypothetical protein
MSAATVLIDTMLDEVREMNVSYGQVIVPQAWLFDNLHVLRRLIARED